GREKVKRSECGIAKRLTTFLKFSTSTHNILLSTPYKFLLAIHRPVQCVWSDHVPRQDCLVYRLTPGRPSLVRTASGSPSPVWPFANSGCRKERRFPWQGRWKCGI